LIETVVNMPNTLQPPLRNQDALEHQLLSLWLNAAEAGLCVIDDTARVVMLNAAACRMFGVIGADTLNAPLKATLQFVEGSVSLIQWLATPGFDGERQVVCKDESGVRQLMLRTQSVRTDDGERYKVVAATDITKLVKAQEEAEQYKRQWQALNAGVVISDALKPDLPIVYVNPAFERMSGYTHAEVMGRNCRFLQGTDTEQVGVLAIRQAIVHQKNGYAVLRNYRKDGTLFLNELFISPVKDAKGVVTHFVGIQHLRADDRAVGLRA
jgi:PAS domain S-box-containing protein